MRHLCMYGCCECKIYIWCLGAYCTKDLMTKITNYFNGNLGHKIFCETAQASFSRSQRSKIGYLVSGRYICTYACWNFAI